MKAEIFKSVAVVLISVISFSSSAKTENNIVNDYVVTPVEKQKLAAGVDQAWQLSYNESQDPVMVELYTTRKCKTYVVRTNHFEVAYVCSKKGFGARTVKASERKVPYELTSQVISPEELSRQRTLSSSPVDEKNAVALIAAYLPDLINPRYKHLLY